MAADAAPVKLNGVVGLATRRWYLIVAGLLVTLPMSYLAAQQVAPTYTMRASVVLLAPDKSVGDGGNPYLAMGGLEAAVDVAAAGLSSDPVQEKLVSTGATSGVVERDASTAAPILLVTVEAPSAGTAANGLAALVDQVPETLTKIQEAAGVEDDQRIHSEVIASSKRPLVSYKPQLRAGLVVLGAGMAGTLMVAALADSLLLRRRRRRAAADDEGRPQLRVSGGRDLTESDDDGVSDLMTARGRKL